MTQMAVNNHVYNIGYTRSIIYALWSTIVYSDVSKADVI